MNPKLVFILFFFSISINFSQVVGSDSILNKKVDSTEVKYSDESTINNILSFFERYQSFIGSIIGAFLAALIAIYSIKRTHKNQILLENEKILNNRHIEEKVYCGFLFSVYSVLLNHKEISKALTRELNAFAENVKYTGDLIIEKPYNRYSNDLLKECLLKTLAYQNYDSDTILFLVTYVNKIDNFDSNLNFIPLLKVRDKHKDISTYAETVNKYFSDLYGMIKLLDELNDKITKLILAYLRNSNAVNMHEYLETLHNPPIKRTP